jgi:hypothetical protein
MTPAAPGYSGKSLADKLGLKPSMRVSAIRAPKEFTKWLAPLPDAIAFVGTRARDVDCAVAFASAAAPLMRDVEQVLPRVREGGILWDCWPKKSSGVATDVTENLLRELILPTGWVDVKVCAVSQTWSGLKFLRRRGATKQK